jgi:hypothetical protein
MKRNLGWRTCFIALIAKVNGYSKSKWAKSTKAGTSPNPHPIGDHTTLLDRKLIMKIYSLLAMAFVLIIFTGCKPETNVDIPTVRTTLIDQIESYISINDVDRMIATNKFTSEVIENTKRNGGISKNSFNIYSIKISDYSHLGFRGELIMKFFNNRLFETIFYPDNYDAYTSKLKEQIPKIFDSKEISILPFTEVVTDMDYQKRKYVSWKDSRLNKEKLQWLRKYS